MAGALVATSIAAVILFLLFAKTFGWDFYTRPTTRSGPGRSRPACGRTRACWRRRSSAVAVLQFILIAILSLWFFGWVGHGVPVLDAGGVRRRVRPRAARGRRKVERNGVRYIALLLMLVPSIGVAALYAYSADFATYTLDATLVIAVTFLGSAIAAAILPWRKRDIYKASPIAKYTVLGIPLITAASGLFILFLVFCLYKWLSDDAYGVNNTDSLIFMGACTSWRSLIFVGSRLSPAARRGWTCRWPTGRSPLSSPPPRRARSSSAAASSARASPTTSRAGAGTNSS